MLQDASEPHGMVTAHLSTRWTRNNCEASTFRPMSYDACTAVSSKLSTNTKSCNTFVATYHIIIPYLLKGSQQKCSVHCTWSVHRGTLKMSNDSEAHHVVEYDIDPERDKCKLAT